MTVEELQAKLDSLDEGVLTLGSHVPGRRFCALEFDAIVRGREWSDAPLTLPDIRPLNDGFGGDDRLRTIHLLPVMAALWDWGEWSVPRKQAWIERVCIETIREIIADLPQLPPPTTRKRCRGVQILEDAVMIDGGTTTVIRAGGSSMVGWTVSKAVEAAAVASRIAREARTAVNARDTIKVATTAIIEAVAWAARVVERAEEPLQTACHILVTAAHVGEDQ